MKNRISIGISSIVLIFLILCLAVFSLLSLSDAKTALGFSERHVDAVEVYYAADARGQTFIRDYRKALFRSDGTDGQTAIDQAIIGQTAIDQASIDSLSGEQLTEAALKAAEEAAKPLPTGYVVSVSDDQVVHCDIPMENGQTLRMELSATGQEVLAYYVYNSQDYVIDTRMPVFGGDMSQ